MSTPENSTPDDFVARAYHAMVPLWRRSVLPIFVGAYDQGAVQGTGTLFRIEREHFLVTAAHVLEDVPDGFSLCVADEPDGSAPLVLPREVWTVRDKAIDVAVWPLDAEFVRALPNREFLTLTSVELSPGPLRNGLFYIRGYPSRMAVKTPLRLHVEPFSYASLLHRPEDKLPNYDPNRHVLLRVEREGNVSTEGEPVIMPRHIDDALEGISGSSMWQLIRPPRAWPTWTLERAREVSKESLANWTPDEARVVAVQTHVYGVSRYVKGTRWQAALAIILNHHPDLDRVVRLHMASRRSE